MKVFPTAIGAAIPEPGFGPVFWPLFAPLVAPLFAPLFVVVVVFAVFCAGVAAESRLVAKNIVEIKHFIASSKISTLVCNFKL